MDRQITVRTNFDISTKFVKVFSYVFVSLFSIACIIPFWVMIISSFASENTILRLGYSLWPKEFSVFAYGVIFSNVKLIIGSYAVTIILTGIGTAVGLFIIAMTGYALQRPDFAYRNKISFFIYFTTLFSGGLIPYYLMIAKYMNLKDNYLAVLLPLLMSPFHIILMKNFLKSIPHAITESAKMDGAGEFTIFLRLIMPMAKPGLATVGLFLALGYWNEWYNSMLFLSNSVKYRPLQLFLYNCITRAEFIKNSAAAANVPPQNIPLETMKMATAVLATGPVILFYPFVQKYFIQGITVGSVKG